MTPPIEVPIESPYASAFEEMRNPDEADLRPRCFTCQHSVKLDVDESSVGIFYEVHCSKGQHAAAPFTIGYGFQRNGRANADACALLCPSYVHGLGVFKNPKAATFAPSSPRAQATYAAFFALRGFSAQGRK